MSNKGTIAVHAGGATACTPLLSPTDTLSRAYLLSFPSRSRLSATRRNLKQYASPAEPSHTTTHSARTRTRTGTCCARLNSHVRLTVNQPHKSRHTQSFPDSLPEPAAFTYHCITVPPLDAITFRDPRRVAQYYPPASVSAPKRNPILTPPPA